MNNEANPDSVRQQTLARLRRVEGQVRGIIKMIESKRGCADVLRQLAATDAALRAAAKTIVKHHLDQCILDTKNSPEMRDQLLKELLETFGRFG